MEYILDTNICIYLIKREPISVLQRLATFKSGHIAISSVTLAELYYGVEKSQHKEKNRTALDNFLSPFEILSFDDIAALSYGSIRSYLEKQGKPIGSLDLMIAAHAKSLELTLVTNNSKEFKRVPDLKVEDWV